MYYHSNKNHIIELKREFESENFNFISDKLDQGIRLKIPTRSSTYPYINILDSYNNSTKTAHICLSKTILDILKRRDYSLYNTLNNYLIETKKYQSTNQDLVPLHKKFYSLPLMKRIIKILKEDYLDSGSEASIRPIRVEQKEIQTFFKRTATDEQKQYNLKKGYNEDWWPYVQDAARERSNYRCDCCGVSVKELKRHNCELTGVSFSREQLLHVHHKDKDKKNDDPNNLSALCVTCHSFQQGPGHEYMRFDNGFKNRTRFGVEYNYFVHQHRILNQLRKLQKISSDYNLDLNTLKLGFYDHKIEIKEKIVEIPKYIIEEKIVYRDKPVEKIVYREKNDNVSKKELVSIFFALLTSIVISYLLF